MTLRTKKSSISVGSGKDYQTTVGYAPRTDLIARYATMELEQA